jgi:multicomponent Na+:H+ antiporter subunit E
LNKNKGFDVKERIKSFFWLFFFLFALWLLLTSTFNTQELLIGVSVCFLIALITHKFYIKLGFPSVSPRKFYFSLVYILVLFYEIIKANLDVAQRVIRPSLPINPGVVIIKTCLRSDIAKTILANSITLTPGTFTLDIQGNKLLIHWIDVEAADIDAATNVIGERFEKYLRIIFQ